jgi:REP element-mobilizing transposase RayT
MSRALRSEEPGAEEPGAFWHVTSRGRVDLYLDDVDRRCWVDLLGAAAVEHGWRVHAYVLVLRHYHLLVQAPMPMLSRGMRQLNGVYSRRFNVRHRRGGPLFEDRFRSVDVPDAYRYDLLRALILKPVRARLVDAPQDWPWSSFAATVGDAIAPSWLDTSWTLSQFGGSARYRAFISMGALWLDAGPVAAPAPSRFAATDVITACVRALGTTRDELKIRARWRRHGRAVLAQALRQFAGLSGAQIAAILDVTKWHASKLARRGEALSKSNGALAAIESALCALDDEQDKPDPESDAHLSLDRECRERRDTPESRGPAGLPPQNHGAAPRPLAAPTVPRFPLR